MPSKRARVAESPRGVNKRISLLANGGGSLLNEDEHVIVPDIDKQSFDNLIKEVTTNQMTDADVWNVKIIDYFAEMKHLSSNGDGSINFQIAGTALHGCVSVLSKKIDSTVSGANTLMNGLSIESSKNDDEFNEDDPEDPEYKMHKKKKVQKIETDPFKVAIVTFNKIKASDKDQIFEMRDPVFKKFIAAFDEGGTKALLANTLRVDTSGRICIDDVTIHDSSCQFDKANQANNKQNEYFNESIDEDTKSFLNVKSESESEGDGSDDENTQTPDDTKLDTILTTSSINKWLDSNLSSLMGFENLNLCSELNDIKRSIEDEKYGLDFVKSSMDKIEKEQDLLRIVEPKFDYDIEDYYNDDAVDFGAPHFSDADNNHNSDVSTSSTNFKTSLDNKSIGLGSNNYHLSQEEESLLITQQMEAMKALDEKFKNRSKRPQWKNDWKIKLVKKSQVRASSPMISKDSQVTVRDTPEKRDELLEDDFEENNEPEFNITQRKSSRKENLIDFIDGKDNFSIFEKATIKIEKAIIVRETTLHDENTWSSERLVKSFIKPKRKFRNMFMRKSASIQPLDADQSFWAKQYNDQETNSQIIDDDAADFLKEAMDDDSGPAEDVLEASPYEDMDIGDANGYDFDAPLNFDAPSSSFAEESAGISPFIQSSSQRKTIQYARRSKKVDVRLLKQNLSEVIHHVHLKDEDLPDEDESEHKRKMRVNIKLSEVVKETAAKYEGLQRDELSTSFYFICMLHLANEQGFGIESTENNNDVVITGETTVGND